MPDGNRMSEDGQPEKSPGIVHRAHTIGFAVQAVIGAAVIISYIGSLFAKSYGNLGFGATLILSAVLALLVTQIPLVIPWGRRHFIMYRSRYPLLSTVFAVLLVSLVLVHDYVLYYSGSSSLQGLPGATGAQGPAGPPGPQGPSGPAASDPRVDMLQQQLNSLLRLALFEGCQQRLAGVEDQFDEKADGAKKLISTANMAGPYPIIIQEHWNQKLDELQAIAKQCAPSIDSRLEPTEDEMHTAKTADEPNADPDLIYNVRKFNLRKARAATLIGNLRQIFTKEISDLRNQEAQNIAQP